MKTALLLLSSLIPALAIGVANAAPPANNAVACPDCGSVLDVRFIKKEGEASGGGAVLGGIVGGVLGHQVGSGRGKDVATVAGAAGGAYAGHQIEKNKNAKEFWQVSVKTDGGNTRYFNFDNQPSYRAGDRVKIVDKRLTKIPQ
jgi:outer membrane lipoprotein SlyB